MSTKHCYACAMLLICQAAAVQALVLTRQQKADIASLWQLSKQRNTEGHSMLPTTHGVFVETH